MADKTLLRDPTYRTWDFFYTWWYDRITRQYYHITLTADRLNPDVPTVISHGMKTKDEAVRLLDIKANNYGWQVVTENEKAPGDASTSTKGNGQVCT